MLYLENSVLKEKNMFTGNISKTILKVNETFLSQRHERMVHMKLINAIKIDIARVDLTQSVFANLYPLLK